jgi:hypothetical protein
MWAAATAAASLYGAQQLFTMLVESKVSPVQIVEEMSEIAWQIGKCLLFSPQVWVDFRLAWNVAEYNGLRTLSVNYKKIWRPDFVLYNA